MIGSVRNFWNKHVGSTRDFDGPERAMAVVGGATLLGAGIGAAVGAAREARDVVTVRHVPYAETVRVPVGSETVHGCYDYHYGYDFSSGDWGYHYGYNPSCTETRTVYQTQYTGRTLTREVHDHTVGFPNTVLGGAALGAGIGLVGGVVGAVLLEVASDRG
ncbi:MAG: hypothetical protein KC910_33360 [Candidatus Eremiobacteraeota bacterium]|nr:hypothetical protein [Candidatus Eremiobacteraeota bacterium]